jgi:hypothetical protein
MTKLLILLGFLAGPCWAFEGYVEGRRFFKNNVPAYPDLKGERQKYGIDFQMTFHPFLKGINLMAGVDASTDSRAFAQVAGRFAVSYKIQMGWEFGVYHRSNHSIDHYMPNFLNDNHFFARYTFND